MGRPSKTSAGGAPPPPTYRDEDSDALSMHTTASNYEYDDVPDLPSYSDSEEAQPRVYEPVVESAPAPADEYSSLRYPTNPLSTRNETRHARTDNKTPAAALGCETSIRMDERLMDPDELYRYVTSYLRMIPPRQLIRISGWHWAQRRQANNKTTKERVFDFDIVFDLRSYLPLPARSETYCRASVISNSTRAHRGSVFQSRARGATQDIEVGLSSHVPTLQDWTRDFCGDRAWCKVFRVSRRVSGLDTETLLSQISTLVRNTHYRGHVDVTFPLSEKHVDVYSPHWINRARISWVRWIFYLTFLWIITWPILFLMTRKWAVYEIDWKFSTIIGDDDEDDGDRQQGRSQTRGSKQYATISENEWMSKHGNLITSLINEGFQGEATDLPVNVEPRQRRGNALPRMPSSGNRNVDSAVSFIQGGLTAWNAISGRDVGTGGGWGADEC